MIGADLGRFGDKRLACVGGTLLDAMQRQRTMPESGRSLPSTFAGRGKPILRCSADCGHFTEQRILRRRANMQHQFDGTLEAFE